MKNRWGVSCCFKLPLVAHLREPSNESRISARIWQNSEVKSPVLHLGYDLSKIWDPLGPDEKRRFLRPH